MNVQTLLVNIELKRGIESGKYRNYRVGVDFWYLMYLFKISESERFEDVVTPVGECQQRGLTFWRKRQLIEVGV